MIFFAAFCSTKSLHVCSGEMAHAQAQLQSARILIRPTIQYWLFFFFLPDWYHIILNKLFLQNATTVSLADDYRAFFQREWGNIYWKSHYVAPALTKYTGLMKKKKTILWCIQITIFRYVYLLVVFPFYATLHFYFYGILEARVYAADLNYYYKI